MVSGKKTQHLDQDPSSSLKPVGYLALRAHAQVRRRPVAAIEKPRYLIRKGIHGM